MEKNDPSKPIPEGWKLVRARQRDRSKVLCYKCAKTGQKFFTYEDLMRYVNCAKENNLPVYCPDLFRFSSSRKTKQKASLFDADRSEGNLELAASESNLPRTSEAEIVEVADPDSALRSSALGNLNTEELCPAVQEQELCVSIKLSSNWNDMEPVELKRLQD